MIRVGSAVCASQALWRQHSACMQSAQAAALADDCVRLITLWQPYQYGTLEAVFRPIDNQNAILLFYVSRTERRLIGCGYS